MRNAHALRRTLVDMLPGLMLFALLMYDPPPRFAAPWILRAYSPLLLWALIRKIDQDCRILGIPFRTGRIPPVAWSDLPKQIALLFMTISFAWAPST